MNHALTALAPILGSVAENWNDLNVRAMVRGEIPWLILGVVSTFIGVAAIAVHLLGSRTRDRSLLWFGLVAMLYGIRLMAGQEMIRLLFEIPGSFWRTLEAFINYAIIFPAALLFVELFGKGWRSSALWPLWGFGAFTAVTVGIGITRGDPFWVHDPANLVLIFLPLVVILNLWRGYRPPRVANGRVLVAGSAFFITLVVADHLVKAGLVPWKILLEPLGYVAFLCSLGYVAALRFLGDEQRLREIEKEMDAARQIQAAILPRTVPSLAGFKMAVRYLPMTAVAGDFYDFLKAGERRLGILVADVSGHGLPAALIASMVKVAISSQAPNAAEPAKVISGLNEMLSGQMEEHYVTAGYLFVDLEKEKGVYAGAGHPPLLLLQKSGRETQKIQENGLPLGFNPEEIYNSVEFDFRAGDRIVMYTDGITEASNAAEELYGEVRLKAFIASHKNLSAEEFAIALLREIQGWCGAAAVNIQTDDLTLLVVDHTG